MTVLDVENLKMLSHKFADGFSAKNLTALSHLFHESISLFDPALKWVNGKKALLDVLEKQFKETKEVCYQVIRLYQEANTSIIEFNLKFDSLVFQGVDFLEWKEEKIIQIRCYYNP